MYAVDSIYIQFKSRPKKAMVIQVRIATTLGAGAATSELVWEEAQGNLGGDQNVLYLDLGSSPRGKFIL